jgi:hypothetical protein
MFLCHARAASQQVCHRVEIAQSFIAHSGPHLCICVPSLAVF